MLYNYIGAQVESDPSLAEVQDVNNPWYVSMVNSMITTDYTPHVVWFCVQLNRILRFAYSFVSECLSFVDECVKPLFNQFAEESFFVRTFLSTHPAISVYCLLYLFVTIVCNVFLRKVYSIINNKQQKKSTSAEQKSFSLNLIVNNFNTIQNVVADSYPTLNRNCAPINVDSKALHDSSNSDKEVSLHLPTVLQKEIALLEPIASLLPAVYEFPSFDLTPTEFIPQILKQIYISEFSFEEF